MSITRFSEDQKLKPVYQAHMKQLGSTGKGSDPLFDY
jgi:hypothetical protein